MQQADDISGDKRRSVLHFRAVAEHGNKKEETVAVFMEKGWEQVVAVYGIMFAGAAYLPIDIHNPRERVEKILRDSGTRIILVQNQAYDRGYRMAARVGLYFCV